MTYSSSLAMSRHQFATRNVSSVKFRSDRERTIGPVSNTIILIVLACLLGLLYLTQVTKTNAYGYKINALQQQQSQLKAKHDDLEVATARLQSLDRVASSAEAKSLVSVAPSGTVQH
jgi:cell division protein FtsL